MTRGIGQRRHVLYYQFGHKFCQGCGKRKSYVDMTVDHIIPRSKGGSDRWSNLQLMCYPCNQSKADQIVA
jgi:5-methylcytosine-specific restriction endonuclease McrA